MGDKMMDGLIHFFKHLIGLCGEYIQVCYGWWNFCYFTCDLEKSNSNVH